MKTLYYSNEARGIMAYTKGDPLEKTYLLYHNSNLVLETTDEEAFYTKLDSLEE